MAKSFLYMVVLFLVLSCNKDDNNNIKRIIGNVWLSGGLYYCAEQIHFDNRDTLIASKEKLTPFKSGDRVNVRYREIGFNKNCISYIDCKIIEINKEE